MTYRLEFKKSVARYLLRLDRTDAERVLTKSAAELPHSAESCPVLAGRFAGLRKFLVGEYRVIFAIIGESVLVTRIAHRRGVHRG